MSQLPTGVFAPTPPPTDKQNPLHNSKLFIVPYISEDHRDRAFSVTGCHLRFICTESTVYCATLGEKGWCSDESTRLPPMWRRFESCCRLHMWFEFVVGSLPCSKRFFSGYFGFPPSQKPIFPNSNFDQESGRRRTT